MRIINEFYRLVRINESAYSLNSENTDIIRYTLKEIVNGEPINDNVTFIDVSTDPVIIDLSKGTFELVILYDESVNPQTKVYVLKNYRTLKQDILVTMRDFICDCSNMDTSTSLSCPTNGITPIAQNLYDMQSLYNSIGLYRDLLLSNSFTRDYRCCFRELLEANNVSFINLLSSLYNAIETGGKTVDSIQLVRLYTAYVYVLFYVMEMDTVTYVGITGGSIPNPPVLKEESPETINKDFDIEDVSKCFTDFNANFYSLVNKLRTCYEQYAFGVCIKTPPVMIPPPPIEAAIADLMFDGWKPYISIYDTLDIKRFTWRIVRGVPTNLILTDSRGTLGQQPVTGTELIKTVNYTTGMESSIKWTLDGDNVEPITLTVNIVPPIYVGHLGPREPAFPTATEIKDNNDQVIAMNLNQKEYLIKNDTTDYAYVWYAFPEGVTDFDMVVDTEVGIGEYPIGPENGKDFIVQKSNFVVIDGINYRVYKYGYPSVNNHLLKFKKT